MNHDERQAQVQRLMAVLMRDETAAIILESGEVAYPTRPAVDLDEMHSILTLTATDCRDQATLVELREHVLQTEKSRQGRDHVSGQDAFLESLWILTQADLDPLIEQMRDTLVGLDVLMRAHAELWGQEIQKLRIIIARARYRWFVRVHVTARPLATELCLEWLEKLWIGHEDTPVQAIQENEDYEASHLELGCTPSRATKFDYACWPDTIDPRKK